MLIDLLLYKKELYYTYKTKIIDEFNLSELTEEEQNDVIKNYVSLPIEDKEIPPLHTTGGSIDLTLVDITTGEELELGIDFDAFSNLTTNNAFESDGMDETIRNNRRILYYAMTKAGFTNLSSEIWYYDYGNREWAFYTKKHALYKGIFSLNDDEVTIKKMVNC